MPYLRDIDLQVYRTSKESVYDQYYPLHDKDARAFNVSIKYIQDMYMRFLEFKNADTAKVCIILVNSQQQLSLNVDRQLDLSFIRIVQLIDIIEIYFYCNILELFKLDYSLQGKTALGFIQQAMLYVCEFKNWDRRHFDSAYNTVLSLGLENKGLLGKAKRSLSKLNYAQLYFSYDRDSYNLYIQLFDKNKTAIKSHLLYRAETNDILFFHYKDLNGSLEWIDENSIRWTSKVDYDGSFISKTVSIDEILS